MLTDNKVAKSTNLEELKAERDAVLLEVQTHGTILGKIQRDIAHHATELRALRVEEDKIREAWEERKTTCAKLDYEIAKLDGRFKVIQDRARSHSKRVRATGKSIRLGAQMKEMALKLNCSIEELDAMIRILGEQIQAKEGN